MYSKLDTTCGHSYCPGDIDSAEEVDWYQAYNICKGMGARLCHEEETDAAYSTGCWFNGKFVWTQTQCDVGGQDDGFLLA